MLSIHALQPKKEEETKMALQPLPGFKSLTTHHCVTGSMRHIYEFHDYPISEDLLLGLGAGVGFVYWHMKGQPPFYGGRANVGRLGEEGLEKTAGRRTGVRVESFHTSSARKAEKALLEMLDAGEPVMIYVDMGFLPYFDLPEGYHFGGHAVVVCGYDPETRQVLIADRDEELHPVSLEDLEKARGSTFKPFPPRHKWYTFDFSDKRPPQPGEVRLAIREVATGMLEPPSPTWVSKASARQPSARSSGRRLWTRSSCAMPASTSSSSLTLWAARAAASSATCTAASCARQPKSPATTG